MTSSNATLQNRIKTLLTEISADMYEREQILAVALLAAIAGHNTFLFGPPGTAKSLISRRLASAFKQPKYFEYLMNRFSTPEEVFGPVSIQALKEDRYIRQIEHYLPNADFAFLDEIWKSSPAILNNLLTIINEHIFVNGDTRINVPLKSLIAASNEVPPENQGLEALYDRFIVRLHVPPIQSTALFNQLLNQPPSQAQASIDDDLLITNEEIQTWRQQLHQVNLSEDTLLVIASIRQKLLDQFDDLKIYVSDRRWQRAAMLLKASAFFNGRNSTNHSDVMLLKYCLWTTPENRNTVETIVHDAIELCGVKTDLDLAVLDREKEKLDQEINKELYHSEDVDLYDTVKLNDGKEYFSIEQLEFAELTDTDLDECWIDLDDKCWIELDDERFTCTFYEELYIPVSQFKTEESFYLIDQSGNERTDYRAAFNEQGCCILEYDCDYYVAQVLYRKGTRKTKVSRRLIRSLHDAVDELHQKLQSALEQVKNKHLCYCYELESPFISDEDSQVSLHAIKKQIEHLELRIADCERLEALCR